MPDSGQSNPATGAAPIAQNDRKVAASFLDCLGDPCQAVEVHGTTFELSTRYCLSDPVGQGAYGVVCAATDSQTGINYAVKKIENLYEHATFTKRTLRELRILRHLQHENILEVLDVRISKSKLEFEDIYVVSPLMETDLASVLKSSQPLTEDHAQL